MTSNWHQYRDTYEGDDQCTRCEIVVTLEAHMTLTLPCPAGDCTSSKNPDRGCVFAPGRESEPCYCIYCGRPGVRVSDLVDPEAELAESDGPLDADAADREDL